MRFRSYTIECDGDSCGGWENARAEIEMCQTRQEAERQARLEGWTLGKRDLCPECQPS